MRIRAIAAIAATGAVLAGWYLVAHSAERQIRKLFDQVASELRKDGQEHPFEQLAKARALAGHVGAQLSIEGMGHRGRHVVDHAGLQQQIAMFRRELQTFSVSFDQLTVSLDKDGTAKAFCNAKCSGLPEWVDSGDAYTLAATLEKDAKPGDWRFVALHFASLTPQ